MQIEELLMTSSKIAIIGGGISGLSLSLFLKQSGFEPVVYEANQPKVDMSGGLQVAPNGMSVLKELNLVSKVIEAGAKNIGVRFYNHTGTLLCSPVYQEPEKYGHPAVNLSRSHLQQILLEECERNHVEIQYGKRLKNIFFAETERPIAVFENHLEIPCDLIVGADGVNSEVRGCLFPNGPRPSHTGLVAFGGFIHPSLLIDKGVSIKKDMLHMTFGPIGFFGYGYSKNHDDDHRLMWWSTIPKDESWIHELKRLSDTEVREILLEIHKGWRNPIENIIRHGHSIIKTPIYDVEHLPRWSSANGRVVLIGDAAHAVSPHSGQGASMALEDSLLLARLLMRFSPKETAKRFEEARKNRVEKIVAEGRRTAGSKRKTGKLAAFFRDNFVRYLLPGFLRKLSAELYNYIPGL